MVALSRPRFWAVSPQKRLPLTPDPSRGAAVTRQDCRPPTCSRTHKVSAVPRLGSGVNVIDLCGEVAYFRHCRVLKDCPTADLAIAVVDDEKKLVLSNTSR